MLFAHEHTRRIKCADALTYEFAQTSAASHKLVTTFHELDADGDGAVTPSELAAGLLGHIPDDDDRAHFVSLLIHKVLQFSDSTRSSLHI